MTTVQTPSGNGAAEAAKVIPDLIGSTLAHYRVVGKLGQGGMGQVYLASDTRLDRKVALKVLPPELAEDRERLKRFEREARALAALNHPNILTIYSVEEDAGVRFFTTEVVEGTTLGRLIPPGGMPLARFFELAVPIADALSAAHERGIAHRDLKPANIMVGADGRPKVLDFGIAKRRSGTAAGETATMVVVFPGAEAGPAAAAGDDGVPFASASRSLTDAGRVLGTVPYMSPEQVKGKPVDHRSDLFSLGVIFYEMIVGERPFQGETSADLISAILRDPPPALRDERRELPPRLAAILGRCLEKDPAARFQSASELREALRQLHRETEVEEILRSGVLGQSSTTALGGRRPRRRALLRRSVAVAVALVAAAAAAGVWLWRSPDATPPPAEAPAVTAAARPRPSVAVLPFQNLSADPELDWLSVGLAEMLVTDLAQSPELDVVGTERVHQILAEAGAVPGGAAGDGPLLAADLVQTVARQAGAGVVIVGSFARAGERLRINVKLQDAASGQIVVADRREGAGEESLFGLVDELSDSVRRSFELAALEAPELDRQVAQITTSSVVAYRYYAEGLKLHWQSRDEEAIAQMERAVEIDPSFAGALNALANLHQSRGHEAQARQFVAQALAHADRLPAHRRYFIEGEYYSSDWTTYGRAIAAFERAVALYPDSRASRSNLAMLYAGLERYEEAVAQYQERIRRGNVFGPTYALLANAYAALGRFEEGERVLEEWVAHAPESWFARMSLGWHLTQWGRLDDALSPFVQAEALRPGEFFVQNGRWRLWVLREEWPRAEAEAEAMAAATDPHARWRGLVSLARTRLYQGRGRDALELYAESARVYPEPGAFSALSHCWAGELLLATGEPERALAEARTARRLGVDQWPERQAIFLAARAQQALGRDADADALHAELERLAATYPNRVETRQLHHLAGLLALARGDVAGAAAALDEARSYLPPRGVPWHWHALPDHVPLWYALAEAEIAAGRDAAAAEWLERIRDSTVEHIEFPLHYVRSSYLLAQLRERQDDLTAAQAHYRRFADSWRGGDLDRPQVEEASRKSSLEER